MAGALEMFFRIMAMVRLWTFMGVSGAVVGGLVMHSVGLGRGYGGMVITTLISMVGAVLLTAATACVNGRRIFARQL